MCMLATITIIVVDTIVTIIQAQLETQSWTSLPGAPSRSLLPSSHPTREGRTACPSRAPGT
eukprot:3898959-Alexandrium_andersonii.AAC.1